MFKTEEVRAELASDLRQARYMVRKSKVTTKRVKPLAGMTGNLPASVRINRLPQPLPPNTARVWSF